MYDDCVENPYEGTDSDDETALTGVVNKYFPAMRDWIHEYLVAVGEKVCVYVYV